jgi:hypothetical protein
MRLKDGGNVLLYVRNQPGKNLNGRKVKELYDLFDFGPRKEVFF